LKTIVSAKLKFSFKGISFNGDFALDQIQIRCSRCGFALNDSSFWCENCHQDPDGNPKLKEVQEATMTSDRIRVAFDGVVLGGGMTINEANREGVFDTEFPQLTIRAMDLERNWVDVPNWKIEKLFSALYAFDAEGWKFYLPAFMCWTLFNWRKSISPTPDWLIGSLTHQEGFGNHFSTLTVTQAKAVLSFLKFCQHYLDEDASVNAIRSYWFQFE
jgi:hypothetical protein